jgi:hypothetical protein
VIRTTISSKCQRSLGRGRRWRSRRAIAGPFGQQLLDIAVAQGEANIEPDRMLDNLGREAMTAVAERSHLDILQDTPLFPPGFRDIGSATAAAGRSDSNPAAGQQ